MKILVDSNRYRDFCEGIPEVVDIFRRAIEIHIPFVVVAELRAGFACSTKSLENERILTRFLHRPRVNLLLATDDTTRHYANLFRQLRAQGTPIPINDLWIAALAVEHDLILLSRDEHFCHLPQIERW
jgi:tRNA(fMet)-specific endonuclease VapC